MHQNNLKFREELKKEIEELIDNVKVMYKYVPIDGAKKLLSNSSFLIRNPSRFNDPFDCYEGLIRHDKIPDYYIRELVNYRFPNWPRKERRRKAHKHIKNGKKELIKLAQNQFQTEKAARAITCFSEAYNNILMWAMYAQSHEGVCIGFNLHQTYQSLKLNHYDEMALLKVKYSVDFESCNFFEEGFKAVINWLRTKSIDWKYEKEIRIQFAPIKSPEIDEFVTFSKNSVSEIFLGSKMNKKNEDEIISLIKDLYPHVKIYKMELSQNSFELIRKEIID